MQLYQCTNKIAMCGIVIEHEDKVIFYYLSVLLQLEMLIVIINVIVQIGTEIVKKKCI